MTYYAGFELFAIRDHNEEMLREVSKLRLEKRLRDNRGSSDLHFFALARRSALPLLRGVGLSR